MKTWPREPLDAEEAVVARAYRALPGGEPSPALDAAILANARAAIAAPRRRRKPWFMGTGFGAAAAAVMAAGIAWQLGWLGDGTGPAPATQQTAPADEAESASRAAEEHDRVEVEFMRQERKVMAPDAPPAPAVAAPPPPPPPAKPRARRENVAPAPTAPPPPPAEPEPLESREQAPALLDAPAPQAFPAPRGEADVSGAAANEGSTTTEHELRDLQVQGRRLGAASKRATLPPWETDVRLEPDAWIERIRERVQNGDRQGAQNSLRRYQFDHPTRPIPSELQRLLVE